MERNPPTSPITLGRRAVIGLAAMALATAVCSGTEAVAAPSSTTGQASADVVRFMTYNIHHGEGVDGRLDLARIADVIRAQNVDLVALQEVDKGTERTGRRDFPAELAALTGMTCVFGKNIDLQGGEYGNAVLSRFPIKRWWKSPLRMLHDGEQRGALQVVVDVRGRELLFVSTHLDHRGDDAERVDSVAQIRGIIAGSGSLPIVIGGDFNDTPGSRMYAGMADLFEDPWATAGSGSGFTIPSVAPTKRIDYLWIRKGSGLVPTGMLVPATQASDHLPVVLEAAVVGPASAQGVASVSLRERVDALIRESGAEVAVAFATLDGRDALMLNEHTVFHAASTMKVPVMVELYRQAATGTLSLDDRIPVVNSFKSVVDGSPYTLSVGDDSDGDIYKAIGSERSYRELCEVMITVSSNLATNVLIDRLGAERVASTMATIGAQEMVVRRGVEDNKAFEAGLNNTATAHGLFTVLMAIARSQAVSPAASGEMIEVLKRQKFRDGIPAGLPPGTPVGHKTGTITKIHHDGGIVFVPRPYVVVVMTRGFADEKTSDTLISAISKAVFESLGRQ
jgi:beta-lactamase class A